MTLQDIIKFTVYFVFGVIVSSLGVIVNRKLYYNIKNEEHQEKGKVIQRILKTYSIVQCISWPLIITIAFVLKANKDIFDVLPESLLRNSIVILRVIYTFTNCYTGFNSLILAITRYTFIVYDARAEVIGIIRLRKFFIFASLGLPIFLAFLNDAVTPIEDTWISRFTPHYNYSFSISALNNVTSNETATSIFGQSPLFSIIHELIPTIIISGMEIICLLMIFLTFSNVVEGFIYFHIYFYCNR